MDYATKQARDHGCDEDDDLTPAADVIEEIDTEIARLINDVKRWQLLDLAPERAEESGPGIAAIQNAADTEFAKPKEDWVMNFRKILHVLQVAGNATEALSHLYSKAKRSDQDHATRLLNQ